MIIKRFASLLLLCMCFASAFADSNDKFAREATKEVWSMDLPQFNAKTVIPDSVAEGQSAVIIAEYVLIDADFNQDRSLTKARNLGNALTNVTTCKSLRRRMVKLLDESAVESFSSVDLNVGADKTSVNNYEVVSENEAFGARVYKPDGTVNDVDISKALKVTKGKKGKDEVTRKLQIPGLAVGDVLEYFIYNYDEYDELSPTPKRVYILQNYPVLNFKFDGVFDPALTVEYRSVNGAPDFATSYDQQGNMTASAQYENLPAIPSEKLLLRARQLPYYRISILNNSSQMVWHPKLARKAGLYPNLTPGTYYREVGEVLTRATPNENLVNNTVKYMKNYMKAHPDETGRKLVDRAWVAMQYYFVTDDRVKGSDFSRSVAFREILRKLKLDNETTGIGIVNSRLTYPTDCLLSYGDVDYFVVTDKVPYCASRIDCMAPGEFPGYYQGESGAAFYYDFKNKDIELIPQVFEIPTTNFNNNLLYNKIALSIDMDSDDKPVNFDLSLQASGAIKDVADIEVDRSFWAREMEDYLEIPDQDRYKPTLTEIAESKSLIEESMKDAAENILGVEPTKITSHKVAALGNLPNAKKMKYQVTGLVDGIVSDAGDGELLVNVGRLFGKNTKLIGNDRKRTADACLRSPSQIVYAVELAVPEGYTVDEESINALNSDLNNTVGCYQVKADLSDDGRTVTFNTLERKMHYFVPIANWADLLAIYDAAAAFNDAAIILTPAK